MAHALAVICVASALFWAWSCYAMVRSIRGIPRLDRVVAPAPPRWPRVSLIVPARDEARDLESNLRARLATDYPDLQVIVVDDRSTDATGAIADAVARDDARVRVVHLAELPAGWLGKPHALDRALAVADGEWLLFSDADVAFAPDALRRAIALCEHDARDHLSVVPEFREHGLGVNATLDVFCQLLVAAGRPWRAADPRSRVALGAGLFNLVRRTAFDRTPGFAWLRMEIADDIALGQMLKQHGARPIVVNAVGSVSLDFYRTLTEMTAGMEKSGYAVIGRFSGLRVMASCAALLALEAGFLLGFAHPAVWVRALTGATLALAWLSQTLMARWMRRSLAPALLFPLGATAMAFMVLRSWYLVLRRGGIDWRGTRYEVRELRAGSRLEIR